MVGEVRQGDGTLRRFARAFIQFLRILTDLTRVGLVPVLRSASSWWPDFLVCSLFSLFAHVFGDLCPM